MQKSPSPLVMLKNGRNPSMTMLCIPGAGATVVSFGELIDYIAGDWRFYGLQPRGMDGRSPPYSSLTDATNEYLVAIENAGLDGPFHLVGHSYGGWSAFDLAGRLCASGRTVASVTIVDSTAPNDQSRNDFTQNEVFQQWIELFDLQLNQPIGIQVKDIEHLPLNERLFRVHARLQHFGFMPKNTSPSILHGPFHTFSAALRSSFTCDHRLHGPVYLITVDDSKLDVLANRLAREETVAGWRKRAPDLEAYQGSGNHLSILKSPHVHTLGSWLSEKLCSHRSVSPQPSVV